MLHRETVSPSTIRILEDLMAIPSLNDFNLAGGTSLALQIGHRTSVDLDFFGKSNLTTNEIYDKISGEIKGIHLLRSTGNVVTANIDGVKLDVVKYRYNLLRPVLEVEGMRLLSKEDIAAIKLAAITGRGRKRDFIDLFFLLNEFSLKEMISFFSEKYPDGSSWLVLKSLTYFADGEEDTDIILLGKSVEWEEMKEKIISETKKITS